MVTFGRFVSPAVQLAEEFKLKGNFYFKQDRFLSAIDSYSEAIILCPNIPVYWTNRALCHRKRNDWARAEEDSRRAIQLDNKSVKAHYILGLSLLQREEYVEGIRELEKALDLGRGADPNGYMVEEIWQELAKAKYLEWENASNKRSCELERLREACERALNERHSKMEGFRDEVEISRLRELNALESVFLQAEEDDIPTDVPDHLCCRITLDILRDPVITPSGHTYERAAILQHLHKITMSEVDPITREPLDPSKLIPNLAIKEAVQAFLDKHGWAYKR